MTRLKQAGEFILGKLKIELPTHLSYHNSIHTLDVLQAAENLSGIERTSDSDKELLFTAALFHDSGFVRSRENHETESCNIARKFLPAYNYDEHEIERICAMIIATKVPQEPQNHLQALLCDADLDYLGRDDFFMLSHQLFLELYAEGLVKDESEWNKQQVEFMESHFYHTSTAVKLRQEKKETHIEIIKSKISKPIFNENQ